MVYLVLAAILLGVVVLVAPISLRYDSEAKCCQVTWLGLTKTKSLEGEKPARLRKILTGERRIPGLAVTRRLWQQRDLCRELSHQAGRFVLEVGRTLHFRDSQASLSLPDPMWNGLLYAAVTQIHLKNVDLSVNFKNRSYAKIWVTVYPHRVARKMAALLFRLPYIRLLRFAWDLKKAPPDRKI